MFLFVHVFIQNSIIVIIVHKNKLTNVYCRLNIMIPHGLFTFYYLTFVESFLEGQDSFNNVSWANRYNFNSVELYAFLTGPLREHKLKHFTRLKS